MRASSSLFAVAALALAACSLAGSLGTGGSTTASPPPAPVAGATDKLVMIDLAGKTADEAAAALRAAGFEPSFEVNRIALECEGVARHVGRIYCQSPEAGAVVDRRAIVNVTVHEGAHVFSGSLVRAQLEKVRGMTIAEAKQYLKSLGHDGEVAIFEQPVFSERCGVDKVCSAEPEGGTGIHDRITLVINPSSSVDIRLPP